MRALNIMKALAGSSWGFTTENLVAMCKAIVRPIMNYATHIWFTQVSSSHMDKLEVIQNKALRIATWCHLKASVTHLRAETVSSQWGRTWNSVPSNLMLAPFNPCTAVTSSLPPLPISAPLRTTLQALFHRIPRGLRVRVVNLNAPPDLSSLVVSWRSYIPRREVSNETRWLGDHPVSGTQQGVLGCPPRSGPSPNSCCLSFIDVPSPTSALDTARSSCPSLQWPHMPRLPCHWPNSGPPLLLSYTSHRSGHGGYVDGTPPGSPIPGRPSAVLKPAQFTGQLRLPPLLNFISARVPLLLQPWRGHFIFHPPSLFFFMSYVVQGSTPIPYLTTRTLKCRLPTWTNLKWSRIKLWGSRLDAI